MLATAVILDGGKSDWSPFDLAMRQARAVWSEIELTPYSPGPVDTPLTLPKPRHGAS